MSQIEIIDNYLPEDVFNTFQQQILSKDFTWSYRDYIVDDYNLFQFIHGFPGNAPDLHIIKPLIYKIRPRGVIRCKVNLRPKSHQHQQSPYHLDQSKNTNHKIAIYYINTNNGYTIFEHNKQQVQSIANRILFFDGHLKHAGVSTTDTKRRVVLNLNYI